MTSLPARPAAITQAKAALARWDNEGGALAPSRPAKARREGEALAAGQGPTG